jgi:hypothetical protein
MRENAEVELLGEAIEAVRNTAGLTVITTALDTGVPDRGYDAILRVGRGNLRTEYAALIKRSVTNDTLGSLSAQLRRKDPRGILVTHQVTAHQADQLRGLNTPFFDTAGNAFLSDPPLYVFVSGRRSGYELVEHKTSRIFMPSGLRTLFALLCNPGLESKSYRTIAAAAQVSHGTIGWVMNDLEKERYIVNMGAGGRRLTRKAELIQIWAERYPQQLRPKLLFGRYTSQQEDWWRRADLEINGAYWGGEVAAAQLTKYLRPQQKTIYAVTAVPEIQARFALKRDPKGEVEILQKFWTFADEFAKAGLVPPLLVYADLMASGDDRNVETAEIIYETKISRLIGETSTV